VIPKPHSHFVDFSDGLKIKYEQAKNFPHFPSHHGNRDNAVQSLNQFLQAVVSDAVIWASVDADIFFETRLHVPLPVKPVILIPVPDFDFDPSEVAIPWKLMTLCGFETVFATEEGLVPQCDQLLLKFEGIFGTLAAAQQAKHFYYEMEKSASFQSPIKWADIVPSDYHGLLLAGGHAPRMKQYLESKTLQAKIPEYYNLHRPLAAICHGVLLLARSKDETGKSVLYERKTTTLPKFMENMAYALTFWKYGSLYRTYKIHCATEVQDNLAKPEYYLPGPWNLGARATMFDDREAFVVEDRNYISGRWPGDAYLFAKKFILQVQDYIRTLH